MSPINEREEVLQRFQKLSIVFVLCAAVALIWGLVLRPIEAAPTPYTAPDVRQETGAQTAAEARRHGIPAVVARKATIDALTEAVVAAAGEKGAADTSRDGREG